MKYIESAIVDNALSYPAYVDLMNQLTAEGKTTGPKQSESLINFTKLNTRRMARVYKTLKLPTDISARLERIDIPMVWLVITESWCGDAAQTVPVFERMAQLIGDVEVKFILRDEHPAIMDAFLTNGARSIPKVIFLKKDNNEVLGAWGPRPELLHKMVLENKEVRLRETDAEKRSAMYEAFSVVLQKWYNSDKGLSTLKEFLEALEASLNVVEID